MFYLLVSEQTNRPIIDHIENNLCVLVGTTHEAFDKQPLFVHRSLKVVVSNNAHLRGYVDMFNLNHDATNQITHMYWVDEKIMEEIPEIT